MNFLGSNYYDLLELQADATDAEIHAAYDRIKATYQQGNVALYSLYDEDDTESAIQRLNEALEVLSHPDKRRQYDLDAGVLSPQTLKSSPPPAPVAPVVSIDRTPPMDKSAGEELLVPPKTDHAPPFIKVDLSSTGPLEDEILQEREWSGAFLKRIREAKRISIEEISKVTRVSKNYLQAIEDENFAKLPAAVFIRGFVTQLAKILKLPHDQVSAAYIERYRKSGFDKNR